MSVRSLAVSPDGAWVYAGADEGGVHRTAVGALVPDDLLPGRDQHRDQGAGSVRPLEPFRVQGDGVREGRDAVGTGDRDRRPRGRPAPLRTDGAAAERRAEVLVPPLVRPGAYTVTAQYEGTDDLAVSEATAALEVRRR